MFESRRPDSEVLRVSRNRNSYFLSKSMNLSILGKYISEYMTSEYMTIEVSQVAIVGIN